MNEEAIARVGPQHHKKNTNRILSTTGNVSVTDCEQVSERAKFYTRRANIRPAGQLFLPKK